jgi:hypothetical protein
MSTKKLVIGTEVFEYPITGSGNYGEQATAWAEAATEVLAEVKGPGDISITETLLIGTESGGFVTGNVSGLVFDTSFVQRIYVTGIITRSFKEVSGLPDLVESFSIEGAYNDTVFNFSQIFDGEDTDVEFGASDGQFTFKYKDIAETLEVRVKYQAKTVISKENL